MTIYISEWNSYSAFSGGDFIEIAAPIGTDLTGWQIYVYDENGLIESGPFDVGTADGQSNGNDVFILDEANDGIALSVRSQLALVDPEGNVVQFLAEPRFATTATEGPAAGLTPSGGANTATGESNQTSDGGATYTASSTQTKGTVACFAAGTMIETDQGPRDVADLTVGDRVRTGLGAVAAITWTAEHRADRTDFERHGPPILIKAGALGPDRPTEDLILSPQHRVLVGASMQLLGFSDAAQLVPAKALLGLPRVREMAGKRHITYHHFTCAQHEVVTANGAAVETLLPGEMVLTGLPRLVQLSLRMQVENGQIGAEPAYPCLGATAARALFARQGMSRKSVG